MSRIALTSLAVALVLLSGTLYGRWTDRWGQAAQDLGDAARKLQNVPMTLGEWDGQPLPELEPQERDTAGMAGYLARRYVNRRDGQVLTLYVFCGQPGPMCTHTPDRCFPGAGFRMASTQRKHPVSLHGSSEAAELWTAEFEKEDSALPMRMRAYWSWTAGGSWIVPDYPRLTFARHRILYKVYLVHPVIPGGLSREDTSVRDFIQQVLPEIQRAAFQET